MIALAPGTPARVNDRCPWPERRGCLAIVVDTRGAEDIYPVHGRAAHEVIVLINADPIPPATWEGVVRDFPLANGQRWSCVMPIDALDVIQAADA